MIPYKKGQTVKGTITGIEKYGAFVSLDEYYTGLIHISEISHGFVKDINDFIKIGDTIYVEILDVDDEQYQLKLSIKDIDYKHDGKRLKRMAETKSGFEPLKDNLEDWIN